MIDIRATVRGERDVPPFTRVFSFGNGTDELVFCNSAAMVKERLARKMRVNVNEALLLYCSYVVDAMRSKKSASAIARGARSVLSEGQVMIGVPETLRAIRFDAVVDGRKACVTLQEPIPAAGYVMAGG